MRFSPSQLVLPLALSGAMLIGAAAWQAGCAAKGTCQADQLVCGDTCVDPLNDPQHCGGCHMVCPSDTICREGACAGGCPTGMTSCGAHVCANLLTDSTNCGECGYACGAGETCQEGDCVGGSGCPTGQTPCSGVCKNLQSDTTACGSCTRACVSGQVCQGGSCVCGTSGVCCGNGVCDTGETSSSCPADCSTPSQCGNGTCDASETEASCPADCTTSTEACGSGSTTCCFTNDPCNWAGDSYCDCGGGCTWDAADCSGGGTCDGSTDPCCAEDDPCELADYFSCDCPDCDWDAWDCYYW